MGRFYACDQAVNIDGTELERRAYIAVRGDWVRRSIHILACNIGMKSESLMHDSSSRSSETQNSEYLEDLQLHGGQPEEEDIRIIALQVTSLPLARDLGKALRVGDDIIVGFIDLSSPSVIRNATLQVIDSWLGNLKEEEREEKLTRLLSEYNISNAKAGRKEISKIPQSTGELLQLCERIDVKASILLEIISGVVTFPAHIIRRIALKMLIKWLDQGGTRERLLEVAQAFRFNDAALKIAEAMESRFPPFISHGIMDHRGVKLFLDKLGITVTIPEGAIPKGMRSVATLQVRTQDSPRIPIQQGEVLITPVIESSLTQELIKPATVVVQLCTNPNVRRDDSPAILYTKIGPAFFGCRRLTNPTSKISRNEITFLTRHLQVFALSSNSLRGLELRCLIFQPVIMDPTQNPTLRIYILHPYMHYVQDIVRSEKCSPVAYCQVMQELKFYIDSTTRDLRIVCRIGTARLKRMIPIKGILCGKVNHVDFELQFTPKEKGKKKVEIAIQEGSIIYAESKFETSIEDVPDYTRDQKDSHGQLQCVPDSILKILAEEIRSPKELKSLAYQLGFSPSATKKYLNQPELSMEMLRKWRRRVRPSQQIDELHAALKNAGLEQSAEIFLPELITTSRAHFLHTRKSWESKK
ncbi:uncharacterized protein LOC121417774 [Lytechinus variegatus]|uniref:uncharacterized protein LOC121417774 n=1 Tax=Lytechinus variegatus TaxID=7654 RepID=UPI001BB299B0|nr:uncharacterized protein LOC121417774 [Lytechinus variegatus]